MSVNPSIVCLFVISLNLSCFAQEEESKPVELETLKASVGVWDAEIEVWPNGLDADSVKFKGVETISAYGEYWLASDFVTDFNGQKMKLHSIVGYDADQEKLVGMVIDHGKYSAKMSGSYDAKTKTETWTTKAKDLDGTPMLQTSRITHKSDTERRLVLTVPDGAKKDTFKKFMEIKFIKRKAKSQEK